MAAKVAMFVFNNTDNDARVHREARALARAGYEVRVYGFFSPPCRRRERFAEGYEVWRLDQQSNLDRWWNEHFPPRRRPRPVPLVELALPEPRPAQRPCPPPAPRQLPLASSPQRRGHRYWIRRVNQQWWRAARAWKPDFCHAHDLDTLWAAQATALTCGAVLLYDSHEIWNEQHFLTDREEIAFWNQWEARLAPSVDAWITVNRSLAAIFASRYRAEVLPLHNCPPVTPLEPEWQGRFKERFEGRPVALFSGGFQASRGLEHMVAAALLQQQVAIVLQGFGPQEPALRRLAEQHNSPVTFLPKAPHDQLTRVCSQADIGVMPVIPDCLNSYYCAPNKVFDYMMAGLPVVVADLPEMATLLDECRNGLLYDAYSPNDLADTLVKLAHDPQRQQLGRASRQWAESTYNWEKESLKLVDLYARLGQQRARGELRPKNWVDPQIPAR